MSLRVARIMRSQGFEPWFLFPFFTTELPAWRAEVLDCPPEGSRLDDDRASTNLEYPPFLPLVFGDYRLRRCLLYLVYHASGDNVSIERRVIDSSQAVEGLEVPREKVPPR